MFPGARAFAFSILDDTDDATVQNVRPIYDLLQVLGLRITKTAWPLDCPEGSALFFAGQTMHDDDYLRFVRGLVAEGFELAMHGATMESSFRNRTEAGLEFFRREFGSVPRIFCNHGNNRENLYWGPRRYQTPLLRAAARAAWAVRSDVRFEGDDPDSPYFWGDLCAAHVEYVRNFAFRTVNVAAVDPHMPYALSRTPYVRYWFSTADAPDAEAFTSLLSEEALDRLCREGGVCIVSTHLGKGFCRDGAVTRRVEDVLRRIAAMPGWFAPVGETLDYLRDRRGGKTLSGLELARLELRHVWDRIARR